MGDLTKNFDRSEFACDCGCGEDHIDLHFVQKLQLVRDEVGFPLRINSGVRCQESNAELGGGPEHPTGYAADVACNSASERYKLLAAGLKHFKRIGVGRTFIHFGDHPAFPQEVIWVY